MRLRPVPKPGRAWSSSGRLNTSTKTGESRAQSTRWSTKSSMPAVGVLGVLDHQHHRLHLGQPLEEQPPPSEELLGGERAPPESSAIATPSSRPNRGPTYRRARRCRARRVSRPPASLVAATSNGVLLGDAEPLSNNLGGAPQNTTPSPSERPRPLCQYMVSASPSTSISNSHPRQGLPTPARPRHHHKARGVPLRQARGRAP